MNSIIATMILNVFHFLYNQNDIISVFTEFNERMWRIYSQSWFTGTFMVLKVIGVGMIMAGCLISLTDKMSDGDFSIHTLFQHLLKYCILYIILWNSMAIFRYLFAIATNSFNEISLITSSIMGATVNDVDENMLIAGVSEIVKTTKLSMLIMLILPYAVSVVYYIVLYFFATSRLIESVLRIAMAPIVVGLSFFGSGNQSDIVRYAKRTMGVFFQIIVVLIISVSVTMAHNSLISVTSNISGSTVVIDPTEKLQIKDRTVEVQVQDSGWQPIPVDDKNSTASKMYSAESVIDFLDSLIDPKDYAASVGLMIAALFMLFKSREISTRLF